MIKLTALPVTLLVSPLLFAPWAAEGAGDGYVVKTYETQTLGKTTGASVGGGNPTATQTVETNTNVKVIGKSLNALNARVENPDTIDIGGTAYTTIYSFGKRIFADAWFFSSGGYNNVRLGLAPTEVRVPFVVYAVGPVTLNVGAGARFQAHVSATLTPEISFPVNESTLGVELGARAGAAAFVEAYAAVVVIRAGLGGQVDLIDGRMNINGRVTFNGRDKPVVLVSGMVEFLKGRIYAFLDVFGFLKLGWKRLIDHNLYNWNGLCYSMGYLQCPAN